MKNLHKNYVYFAIAISLLNIFFLQTSSAAEKSLLLWRERTYVKDADVLLDKQINEWGKKNNCKVVIESYTFDEKATKYTTAIENKTLPDIAEFDTLSPARLHDIGRLEDVSDVVKSVSKELGKVASTAEANLRFGGKYYAVPHFVSTEVIYYRKDILNKLGLKPPQTWEELFDQARKIKKAGIMNFPVGLPWNRTADGQDPALTIFWNEGASWCDSKNYYKSINTPEGLKAVNLMIQAYIDDTAAKDYLAWPGAGNNEAWMAGTICYTSNGPSIIWQLRNFKHPLLKDTGIMLIPKGTHGQVQGLTGVYSWGICRDRGPGNIPLAKSLIAYLMRKDNITEYMKVSVQQASIPYEDIMRSDYWNDEFGKVVVSSLRASAPLGWPGVTTVASAEVMTTNVLTDIAGRVIIDKASPIDALKEADGKIRAIYERFKLIK